MTTGAPNGPTLLAAGQGSSNSIYVFMSDECTTATVEDTSNWSLSNGISVTGSVKQDEFSVLLTTSGALSAATQYLVTATSGILRLSDNYAMDVTGNTVSFTTAGSPPTVTSATCLDATTVDVTLSHECTDYTAEDADRWSLDNSATVSAASKQADPTVVRLTTSPLTGGSTYMTTASGLVRLSDSVSMTSGNSAMFMVNGEIGGSTSGWSYIDNLMFSTEPSIATGNNGWFLSQPEIYVSTKFAGTYCNYWFAVGTSGNRTEYVGATSGVATNTVSVVCSTGSYVSAANYDGVYLYYGLTSTVEDMVEYPISMKWFDSPPYWEAFAVQTLAGADQSGPYLNSTGKFVIHGIRGYTANLTSGEYLPRVNTVRIYGDGQSFIEVRVDTVTDYPNVQCIYPARDYDGRLSVDPSYTVYGDVDKDHFILELNYKQSSSDVPSYATTFYATIENDVGYTLVSDSVSLSTISEPPVIDRVFVSASGANNLVVAGTTVSSFPIGGVEYTLDRRVPLLDVPFSSSGVVAQDGDPQSYLGATFITGPFPGTTGNTAISISSGSVVGFVNSCMSFDEGTLEFWWKPISWSDVPAGPKYLFSFAKTTPAFVAGFNEISLYATNIANPVVRARVCDTFGNEYYSTYTFSDNLTTLQGKFTHIRMTWVTNDPDRSKVGLFVDGVEGTYRPNATSSGLIMFGELPSVDMAAATISGSTVTTNYYSPLVLGDYVERSADYNSYSAFADLRVSDIEQTDSQWNNTTYGGWKEAEFDSNNGMFRIALSGLADNYVEVMRIRGVGSSNLKLPSTYFNTSSCRPILIRAPYTGVALSDAVVYRFRLIDAQGKFEDLRFAINPSQMTVAEGSGDRISQSLMVNGRRGVRIGPKLPEGTSFSWDNLSHENMMALRDRSDSGNSFYLIDHHDKVYFGKLSIKSIDEIVATVPSRYRVSLSLIGQGDARGS